MENNNNNKILACCIGVIIITLIIAGIGMLNHPNNNTNTNNNGKQNITLADGTKLAIPSDFTVKKPFSNYTDNDGFYYTNCELESKNYGWIYIEYTHDPVETMMHSSNSTKAIADSNNSRAYEFDVFDADGHRVMKVRGSNPGFVEDIGKSVKF